MMGQGRPMSPVRSILREVGGEYTVDATDAAAVKQAKNVAYSLRQLGFEINESIGASSDELVFRTIAFVEPDEKPAKPKAKPKTRASKERHPALSTLLRVTTIGEAPEDGIVLALTDEGGRTWVARLESM